VTGRMAASRRYATWLWALRRLPPRVALFQARALALAVRLRDDFALRSVSRPGDVRLLLDLARGRRVVAELGTATGWTAASLALADPERRVVSFDPLVQAHRERYLALAGDGARRRVALHQAAGVDGAALAGEPVELLFVDSTHAREDTVAEFRAWREHLAPGALVAFHDHGNPAFPGVAEAVRDLALDGRDHGGVFVWRAPG
jgi:predicted O-methyltransferase YrrM